MKVINIKVVLSLCLVIVTVFSSTTSYASKNKLFEYNKVTLKVINPEREVCEKIKDIMIATKVNITKSKEKYTRLDYYPRLKGANMPREITNQYITGKEVSSIVKDELIKRAQEISKESCKMTNAGRAFLKHGNVKEFPDRMIGVFSTEYQQTFKEGFLFQRLNEKGGYYVTDLISSDDALWNISKVINDKGKEVELFEIWTNSVKSGSDNAYAVRFYAQDTGEYRIGDFRGFIEHVNENKFLIQRKSDREEKIQVRIEEANKRQKTPTDKKITSHTKGKESILAEKKVHKLNKELSDIYNEVIDLCEKVTLNLISLHDIETNINKNNVSRPIDKLVEVANDIIMEESKKKKFIKKIWSDLQFQLPLVYCSIEEAFQNSVEYDKATKDALIRSDILYKQYENKSAEMVEYGKVLDLTEYKPMLDHCQLVFKQLRVNAEKVIEKVSELEKSKEDMLENTKNSVECINRVYTVTVDREKSKEYEEKRLKEEIEQKAREQERIKKEKELMEIKMRNERENEQKLKKDDDKDWSLMLSKLFTITNNEKRKQFKIDKLKKRDTLIVEIGSGEDVVKALKAMNTYLKDVSESHSKKWNSKFVLDEYIKLLKKTENSEALYSLSNEYKIGTVLPQSDSLAFKYCKNAADINNIKAQYEIGCYFLEGKVVEKNLEKAFYYFKKSADSGKAESQYNVGCCYKKGEGIKPNNELALTYLKMAADNGIPEAEYTLGKCYSIGKEMPKNIELALVYLKRAADKGHDEAAYNVGIYYMEGTEVEKNLQLSFHYFEKSAEAGNFKAMNNVACCYLNGDGVEKNVELAIKNFLIAAENGSKDSMYNIGNCYLEGTGVAKNNELAFKYFKMAADMGHIKAKNNVGRCYSNGEGVKQNFKLAFSYLKEAAEKGDIDARYNLAKLYVEGKGTGQDKMIALKFLNDAADAQDTDAQNILARYYIEIKNDFNMGFKYLKESADNGNVKSIYDIKYYYITQKWPKEKLKAVFYYLHNISPCDIIQEFQGHFDKLKKSADQGDILSQYILGGCYLNGIGTVRNIELAFNYFKKAADKGYIDAMCNIGSYYIPENYISKDV